MAYKITEIEGIGPKYGATLGKAGINTTDDLLDKCADKKGRKATGGETGLREWQLLIWATMADLMRISVVGDEYSGLLEAGGVDTVKELIMRCPDKLTAKMKEVIEAKKLTRQTPSESQVTKWVEQAKTLEPKISH